MPFHYNAKVSIRQDEIEGVLTLFLLSVLPEYPAYYLIQYQLAQPVSFSAEQPDMDKFVEKLSAYNIPLEGLDFYNDMDGISNQYTPYFQQAVPKIGKTIPKAF